MNSKLIFHIDDPLNVHNPCYFGTASHVNRKVIRTDSSFEILSQSLLVH
jgi:hypothetical protein